MNLSPATMANNSNNLSKHLTKEVKEQGDQGSGTYPWQRRVEQKEHATRWNGMTVPEATAPSKRILTR